MANLNFNFHLLNSNSYKQHCNQIEKSTQRLDSVRIGSRMEPGIGNLYNFSFIVKSAAHGCMQLQNSDIRLPWKQTVAEPLKNRVFVQIVSSVVCSYPRLDFGSQIESFASDLVGVELGLRPRNGSHPQLGFLRDSFRYCSCMLGELAFIPK